MSKASIPKPSKRGILSLIDKSDQLSLNGNEKTNDSVTEIVPKRARRDASPTHETQLDSPSNKSSEPDESAGAKESESATKESVTPAAKDSGTDASRAKDLNVDAEAAASVVEKLGETKESAAASMIETSPIEYESGDAMLDVPPSNTQIVNLAETDIIKKYTYDNEADALDRDVGESDDSLVRKTRAAKGTVTRTFKEFMQQIRRFHVGKSTAGLIDLTKSVKSSVRSFDDIISNIPVKRAKNGVLTMGEVTVGTVHRLAREGDLASLAKLSGRTINIGAADKKAFSSLVGSTPEKSIRNVTDNALTAKKLRPTLDVSASEVSKLPAAAKTDLSKVTNNLLKKFKQGTVIALTIGAVYVGVDWISKATAARKGCYMLTTINNKTTSCKMGRFTCSGDASSNLCSNQNHYNFNTTLILMAYAQYPNNDQIKIDLCKQLNIKPEDLASSLKMIIDEKFDIAAEFIDQLKVVPTINVCDIKSSQVENGIIPDCRVCSPSANPTSTMFIDSNAYPENVTFQCVTNPSILDTITDAAISTATDLWDGVGKIVNIPVKKIAIGVVVATIILLILWVVSKFMMRPKYPGQVLSNYGGYGSAVRFLA